MGCHFRLQDFLAQALYIIILGSSRRGIKAFPESAGSELPSAQNNPYVKVADLEVAYSAPPQHTGLTKL